MPRDPYARRWNPAPLIIAILTPFVVASVAVIILVNRAAPVPESGELPSTEEGVTTSVFIPFAEWDEASGELRVAAIVTARVDPEGTCSLLASNGSDRLTVEAEAIPDASTMACGTMVVSDGLHPGLWSVTAAYRSGGFEAVSEAVDVEVGG
jgi:hypothetical protein